MHAKRLPGAAGPRVQQPRQRARRRGRRPAAVPFVPWARAGGRAGGRRRGGRFRLPAGPVGARKRWGGTVSLPLCTTCWDKQEALAQARGAGLAWKWGRGRLDLGGGGRERKRSMQGGSCRSRSRRGIYRLAGRCLYSTLICGAGVGASPRGGAYAGGGGGAAAPESRYDGAAEGDAGGDPYEC
ncbi:hypothetical protein VTK56DRAFT_7511 [Thermocarpiscus australiensis]